MSDCSSSRGSHHPPGAYHRLGRWPMPPIPSPGWLDRPQAGRTRRRAASSPRASLPSLRFHSSVSPLAAMTQRPRLRTMSTTPTIQDDHDQADIWHGRHGVSLRMDRQSAPNDSERHAADTPPNRPVLTNGVERRGRLRTALSVLVAHRAMLAPHRWRFPVGVRLGMAKPVRARPLFPRAESTGFAIPSRGISKIAAAPAAWLTAGARPVG